ncbi:MAG: PKD domain-containing protein, partial [Candidatus Nanopelagicales bacterium]
MNGRRTSRESRARLRPAGAGARRGRAAVATGAATALVTSLLVAVASVVAAPAASAATGDYGTSGASIVGFPNTTPTATKPESKLWFAQGSWWAAMASATTGGYAIHRLDRASSAWVDTGVALDPRGATQSDVLWNGTHLFVASHAVASNSSSTSSVEPSLLLRYSWSGTTWTPDPGFPVQITARSSESLVIAQTDSGRIWATWTLNKRLYLAQTSGSADASTVTFNSSFIPVMSNLTSAESTAATTLTSDDISTVVSADGVTTLVWSNQVTGTTWSARRSDTGSTWAATPVVTGALMSDDHVNLRAIPGDPQGRVVAVLKTSRNDASAPVATDPLVVAAVYVPATGTWTAAAVATVAESATRPMAVVEPGTDEVHVYYTGPTKPGAVAYTGTVYEKSASLSDWVFPATATPALRDVANASMNNATSSKQTASAESGVVVLAATDSSPRYWFSDSGGAATPAAPTASFSASTTSGTAPLSVSFTDTSTGSPTSWSWSFGDGGTSSVRNPSYTFASPGSYTVTLTASNAGGSTSATTTVVVSAPVVQAPTASFSASTTSGTAPLSVSFSDYST